MVSRESIRNRKRYAEDSEYREKKLASNRAHRAAHKDEINASRRARRRSDPEFRARERANKRRRRYGMSDPDYEALLARQGGVCAICRMKSDHRLVVDHCHFCDRVRGLLCNNCNVGLGYYCDDTSRLRAAIAYLERTRHAPPLSTAPTRCACAAIGNSMSSFTSRKETL
jgi:hypothetical protein